MERDRCERDKSERIGAHLPDRRRPQRQREDIEAGGAATDMAPHPERRRAHPDQRVILTILKRVDRNVADHPRSEERRGGKECVSKCRSRWSANHHKTKQIIYNNTTQQVTKQKT